MKDLVKSLCVIFDANEAEVMGLTRKRSAVEVRQCVHYFLRNNTKHTCDAIGAKFGQDHCTAHHGEKTFANLLATDKDIAYKYQQALEPLTTCFKSILKK